MKINIKLFWIIAIITAIGFLFVACDGNSPKRTYVDEDDSATSTSSTPDQDANQPENIPLVHKEKLPEIQTEENTLYNKAFWIFASGADYPVFATDVDEIVYLLRNPNRIEHIPHIIRLLQVHGVWDTNEDNLVDCIDYSIFFRRLYGNDASLIINTNPTTGMNHMFNRVHYLNGFQFMDIEPQGIPERYSMHEIWGEKYDPFYNRDATYQYREYLDWK